MKQAIFLLAIVCLLPFSLTAADWNKWRGPNDDHTGNDRSESLDALQNGHDILWRAEVGYGHSCIAVRDGRGYTMGENRVVQNEDTAYTESVLCLDLKTGRELWRHAYPAIRRRYPGPGATPWITDTRLYTQTHEGTVLCLKISDGTVLWKKDLVAAGLTEPTPWGCCSSPILDGDILLVNAGVQGVALNPNTGEILWSGGKERSGHGSPVVFTWNQQRVAAMTGENAFHVVDVKTGGVKVTHAWDADSDPVILDDHIFLMGSHAKGKGCGLFKIDGTSLVPVWENRLTAHAFQPPIIIDGHAYVFTFQNVNRQPLQCIDLKTGIRKWSHELGIWGAMTASGENILFLTGTGELVIVQANPNAFTKIARANIFDLKEFRSYPDGEPHCCWTVPVLVDGMLLVRTTYGHTACIDLTPSSPAD